MSILLGLSLFGQTFFQHDLRPDVGGNAENATPWTLGPSSSSALLRRHVQTWAVRQSAEEAAGVLPMVGEHES